ncbi:MAG: hypothetical protein IJX62_06160 [Clostridia bacterium]|nr:hypothetical protein [Clostridia bacterium]
MEDFRAYAPEDAINANLQELSGRFDRVCEQELAHLRELAAEITASLDEHPELILSLPDHVPPMAPAAPDVLPANGSSLEHFHRMHATWQKVTLCREIQRQLLPRISLSPEFFFPDPEDVPLKAFHRVVYQKSSYTDDAYLQFASMLAVPRVSYAHSFVSACEDVYNGLCEFCILPVENTAEGPLNSFLRLIKRYDLKIAATCTIKGTDRSGNTRFALLRRNMTPLLDPSAPMRIFEFDTPVESTRATSDLLLAAQLCDLRLQRLDAIPGSEDAEATTHFTFLAEPGALQVYLLYLAMDAPNYEPLGIYSPTAPHRHGR